MNRVSQLSIFAIALALLTLALGAGWAVADTIVVPSSDVTMLAQDDESDEEGDEEDEDEDELA